MRRLKTIEQRLESHLAALKPKLPQPSSKQEYFTEVLRPLLSVAKEDNQKEIKCILTVMEIFVNALGDTEKVEAEVIKRWEAGDYSFNDQQYELAKKLFLESDFFSLSKKGTQDKK